MKSWANLPAIALIGILLILSIAAFVLPAPVVRSSEAPLWPASEEMIADQLSDLSRRLRSSSDQPQEVEAQRPLLEQYQVIGAVESGGRRIILVSGQGQVHSLELGEEVAGYTLAELGDGFARFEGEAGSVTLQLPY